MTGTFAVSDVDVGNTLTASINGTPTLVWSGGALSSVLTAGQISTLTEALVTGELTIGGSVTANGGAQTIGYTWDPEAAALDFLAAGQTLTVTYQIQVSDGTTTTATQPLSFVITGTNDAPTSSNDSVTTNEDTTVILALSDFGTYADLESTPIASVRITTLEANGSLEFDTTGAGAWAAVTLNQDISAAHISAGRLRFVPDANENGSPYATVGFQVSDGTALSAAAYTLTVNVTAVNDPSTDLVFTGNSSLNAGLSGGFTTITGSTLLFTVSTVDPDNTTPFTYSFNGNSSHAVTVGGIGETFDISSSTGAVTTDNTGSGSLSYNTVQTITFANQPRSRDALNQDLLEPVTLRLGLQNAGDTIDGSATTNDQVIYGFGGNDQLTGGSGADWISGGAGNDTIVGAVNDIALDGGADTDTLQVGANFTSTGNGQIANIENVLLTAAVTVNFANQTEGFTITGSSGADSITGGSAADIIVGAQNDTLLDGGGNTDTLQVGATFQQ
jgi:VCBS repeat-containing protein